MDIFGQAPGLMRGTDRSRIGRQELCRAVVGVLERTGEESSESQFDVLPEDAREPYKAALNEVNKFCSENNTINESNLDDFYKVADLCLIAQQIPIIVQQDWTEIVSQIKHLFTPISGYAQGVNQVEMTKPIILNPEVWMYERLIDIANFVPVCLLSIGDIMSSRDSKNRDDIADILEELVWNTMSVEIEWSTDKSVSGVDFRNIIMNIYTNFRKWGMSSTWKIKVIFWNENYSIVSLNKVKTFNDEVPRPHSWSQWTQIMDSIIKMHEAELIHSTDQGGYRLEINWLNYCERL